MHIAILEMPLERTHRVKLDDVTIEGWVTKDDFGWIAHRGEYERSDFQTREIAALELVQMHYEAEHAAIEAKRPVTPEHELFAVFRCDQCRREYQASVLKPPSLCSCGSTHFEQISGTPVVAPEREGQSDKEAARERTKEIAQARRRASAKKKARSKE